MFVSLRDPGEREMSERVLLRRREEGRKGEMSESLAVNFLDYVRESEDPSLAR